jgi:hypothetical protein
VVKVEAPCCLEDRLLGLEVAVVDGRVALAVVADGLNPGGHALGGMVANI